MQLFHKKFFVSFSGYFCFAYCSWLYTNSFLGRCCRFPRLTLTKMSLDLCFLIKCVGDWHIHDLLETTRGRSSPNTRLISASYTLIADLSISHGQLYHGEAQKILLDPTRKSGLQVSRANDSFQSLPASLILVYCIFAKLGKARWG
jgi:hypothetical protein